MGERGVWGRERGRERKGEGEREREIDREKDIETQTVRRRSINFEKHREKLCGKYLVGLETNYRKGTL